MYAAVEAWRFSKARFSLVWPLAVGVERWIDVDQIDAGIGQVLELFQAIAAVADAGVEQSRPARRRSCTWCGCFRGICLGHESHHKGLDGNRWVHVLWAKDATAEARRSRRNDAED